jgi:hypothetical protein
MYLREGLNRKQFEEGEVKQLRGVCVEDPS